MKTEFTEAEQACVDIYNDYDESEVDEYPSSVVGAWYIGKGLCRAN